MIIATVRLKGREEKRKEILQTITGLGDQVRMLKGCLNVDSYQDINNKNTFCLIEMWQSQHEMEEYLHSKLYAALLGVKTLLVEEPEVKILVEDSSYNCDNQETRKVH